MNASNGARPPTALESPAPRAAAAALPPASMPVADQRLQRELSGFSMSSSVGQRVFLGSELLRPRRRPAIDAAAKLADLEPQQIHLSRSRSLIAAERRERRHRSR